MNIQVLKMKLGKLKKQLEAEMDETKKGELETQIADINANIAELLTSDEKDDDKEKEDLEADLKEAVKEKKKDLEGFDKDESQREANGEGKDNKEEKEDKKSNNSLLIFFTVSALIVCAVITYNRFFKKNNKTTEISNEITSATNNVIQPAGNENG